MNKSSNKQGWIITFAALGINLVMGVLYSWGVIGKALINTWGWTSSEASLPFTVSAAVFAITRFLPEGHRINMAPDWFLSLVELWLAPD